MSDTLIPVVGTLAGALIGGGVSLLAQRMTARYARENQIRNMAEERARWAAEERLGELKKLYGQVADFLDATEEFRIHFARETYLTEGASESKATTREEYNSKRGRWEAALNTLHDDILIFDDEIYDEFGDAIKPRQQWFIANSREEGLVHLLALENNLKKFSKGIAERYRRIFADRRQGKDI